MATYAVGDVQGCHRELMALLTAVDFAPGRDRLWLTGDLVNRGPQSAEVLRTIMALGDSAVCVLGNHDLHLLALALLPEHRPRRRDTLGDVLDAPDRDALIAWLRQRPLLHVDTRLGVAMVHAGVPPQWTLSTAADCAREVEQTLRDPQAAVDFLRTMYGDTPVRWRSDVNGLERLRFITNCLTRMRYCTGSGDLDLAEKGPPRDDLDDLVPWYAMPGRCSRDTTIVFGHWSTLHLNAEDCRRHNVYPLDTGAVWGESLTALRLDDRVLFSVSSSLPLAHE
ncbi:MAG: symmetrical bis(5'-nucleosyl)-tetraphosphatase [Gammaproteobacteria bacterium]